MLPPNGNDIYVNQHDLFLGRCFTATVGKCHTAHADRRYFNIPQFSCFHNVTSFKKAFHTAKHKPVCYLDYLLNRLLLAFLDTLPVNAEDRVVDKVHQYSLLIFRQRAVFFLCRLSRSGQLLRSIKPILLIMLQKIDIRPI